MPRSTPVYNIIFVCLLGYVTSYIVYYGFVSQYATIMFGRKGFVWLYDTGVFHYRILSKIMLLKFDDWIDPSGKDFYGSTFDFNTFFILLTGIALAFLVDLDNALVLSPGEKYFILFLVPVVINLTQFVVVPYDISGYFFQLLITVIFLRYYETNFALTIVCVCLLLIVSTTNRESSAVTVSFLLAILLIRDGFTRKTVIAACAFSFAFVATYALLRVVLKKGPPDPELLPGLKGNMTAYVNILGLVFWFLAGSFNYMISSTRRNQWLIICFHLFSLPYIFVVLKDGIPWEMRLYIPLFLAGLVCSKLKMVATSAALPPKPIIAE